MKKGSLCMLILIFTSSLSAQNSKDIDSVKSVVQIQKDSVKVKSLIKIGKMFMANGMPDSALLYDKMAIANVNSNVTKLQTCAVLLATAETETALAKYDDALEHLFTIIKMAEQGGCGAYGSKAKPAIGFIYIWQKKEKEALHYYLEAESELQKWKDTSGLLAVYGNLPVCVALNGDTIKAMEYFRKGFDIVDRYALSKSPGSRAAFITDKKLTFTYNMVNFLTRKEDLMLALGEIQNLQQEVETGTDQYQQFNLFSLLADIYLRLKDYEKSLHYGEMAAKLTQGQGNYGDIMNLYWVIARAAAALKQYEKAYNSTLVYNQYNDSVFKFSRIEAINAVEAKYKVEKKEQEIVALNKEKKAQRFIVILAIAGLIVVLILLAILVRSKKLQKELFVKEKELQKNVLEQKMFELEQTALRAQMNPHFIFNCLNSVQRYVINNDAAGVNHYLVTFANLIRQTLENSGKQTIPLKDEIRYLETYISMEQLRSHNGFDYTINIDTGVDVDDIAIPNMIVQPFVENSIQHGMINTKGEKSAINMHISITDKLIFVVEDNGMGIKNRNGLKQEGEEQHISMGGTITEKRIQMYNSLNKDKIELQLLDKSEVADGQSGTKIILKFPLNN